MANTEQAAWEAFLHERQAADRAAKRGDEVSRSTHRHASVVLLHVIGEGRGLDSRNDNENDDDGGEWLALWEEAHDQYVNYAESVAS